MPIIDAITLERIQGMVQNNDHGSAYLTTAIALGVQDLIEEFTSINRRQTELGYLPPDLYQKRHLAYLALLAKARSVMFPNEYKLLYRML